MINRNEYNKIPSKARYSMIVGNIIGLAIAFIILVSVWKILNIFPIPRPVFFWYKCLGGLIIGYLVLLLVLEPSLGYKRHLYRINDESIDIIKGIFFHRPHHNTYSQDAAGRYQCRSNQQAIRSSRHQYYNCWWCSCDRIFTFRPGRYASRKT